MHVLSKFSDQGVKEQAISYKANKFLMHQKGSILTVGLRSIQTSLKKIFTVFGIRRKQAEDLKALTKVFSFSLPPLLPLSFPFQPYRLVINSSRI